MGKKMSAESRESQLWLPDIWRVKAVTKETFDTVTLEIVPQNKSRSMEPQPGQFNMLYSFGIGEVPISFSGIVPSKIRHTIRNVGAVSRSLTLMQPGMELGVRGPFGRPWDLTNCETRDILVIAGGVGLAPLRPLIIELIRRKHEFGKIFVLYGARDPSNLLFNEEKESWQQKLTFLRTVDTLQGRGNGEQIWKESVGVVPELLSKIDFEPNRTTAFVCGPDIMIRYAVSHLVGHGVLPVHVYLSMERNMKCAIGFCGHCQFGGQFICKDGPVFSYDKIAHLLNVKEL